MSIFDRRRMFSPPGSPRDARPSRLYGPLQGLAIVGLALLLISRTYPTALEPVREAILLATRHVATLATAGLQPIVAGIAGLAVQWSPDRPPPPPTAEAEIARLTARLDAVTAENAALRALVPTAAARRPKVTAAPVIAGHAGPLAQTLVIAAGRDAGIRAGHPVVLGDRLIGRVLAVQGATSTALRPSDRLSRVPVLVGSGQARAILVGSGDGSAVLDLVGPGATLAVGDVVVTSGVGGIFPRGLVAGTLASTGATFRVDLDLGEVLPAAVGVLDVEEALIDPSEGARSAPATGSSGGGGVMRPASGSPVGAGEGPRR